MSAALLTPAPIEEAAKPTRPRDLSDYELRHAALLAVSTLTEALRDERPLERSAFKTAEGVLSEYFGRGIAVMIARDGVRTDQ